MGLPFYYAWNMGLRVDDYFGMCYGHTIRETCVDDITTPTSFDYATFYAYSLVELIGTHVLRTFFKYSFCLNSIDLVFS